MTKLVVTLLVCALLAGAAMYVGGIKVAPAVATKSENIGTSLTNAKVDQSSGLPVPNIAP